MRSCCQIGALAVVLLLSIVGAGALPFPLTKEVTFFEFARVDASAELNEAACGLSVFRGTALTAEALAPKLHEWFVNVIHLKLTGEVAVASTDSTAPACTNLRFDALARAREVVWRELEATGGKADWSPDADIHYHLCRLSGRQLFLHLTDELGAWNTPLALHRAFRDFNLKSPSIHRRVLFAMMRMGSYGAEFAVRLLEVEETYGDIDTLSVTGYSIRQETRRILAPLFSYPVAAARLLTHPIWLKVVSRRQTLPQALPNMAGATVGTLGDASSRNWETIRGVGFTATPCPRSLVGQLPHLPSRCIATVFGEETISGPTMVRTEPQARGYSIPVHEMAHALHYYGLLPGDQTVIANTYKARLANDGLTVDGRCRETSNLGSTPYSCHDAREYFAQLVCAWLGTNVRISQDADEKCLVSRNSQRWIIENEPLHIQALLLRYVGTTRITVPTFPETSLEDTMVTYCGSNRDIVQDRIVGSKWKMKLLEPQNNPPDLVWQAQFGLTDPEGTSLSLASVRGFARIRVPLKPSTTYRIKITATARIAGFQCEIEIGHPEKFRSALTFRATPRVSKVDEPYPQTLYFPSAYGKSLAQGHFDVFLRAKAVDFYSVSSYIRTHKADPICTFTDFDIHTIRQGRREWRSPPWDSRDDDRLNNNLRPIGLPEKVIRAARSPEPLSSIYQTSEAARSTSAIEKLMEDEAKLPEEIVAQLPPSSQDLPPRIDAPLNTDIPVNDAMMRMTEDGQKARDNSRDMRTLSHIAPVQESTLLVVRKQGSSGTQEATRVMELDLMANQLQVFVPEKGVTSGASSPSPLRRESTPSSPAPELAGRTYELSQCTTSSASDDSIVIDCVQSGHTESFVLLAADNSNVPKAVERVKTILTAHQPAKDTAPTTTPAPTVAPPSKTDAAPQEQQKKKPTSAKTAEQRGAVENTPAKTKKEQPTSPRHHTGSSSSSSGGGGSSGNDRTGLTTPSSGGDSPPSSPTSSGSSKRLGGRPQLVRSPHRTDLPKFPRKE